MTETPEPESTVIPIRPGELIVKTGNPNAAVISLCRDLLERAERGEVVSVGVYEINPVGGIFTHWEGGEADSHKAVAAVTLLYKRIVDLAFPPE